MLMYLPSKIFNKPNKIFTKITQINKKSLSMLMGPDSQDQLTKMDKVMAMELSTILTAMQPMKGNGNMEILMVKAYFSILMNSKWRSHTITVILQKWMNTSKNSKESSTMMLSQEKEC